jgi:signal transduction histidine kinase
MESVVKNLKIKQKMLILTAVPLILAVVIITGLSIVQIQASGEMEKNTLRTSMMADKETALKDYMSIVETAIRPILKDYPQSSLALPRLKDTLTTIRYGDEDGYIFAFSYDGTTMVHAGQPQLVGENLIDMQDTDGTKVIAELIKAARTGGGFVEYRWHKPSEDAEFPKLSYATNINELGWMIGTGFYIDDIDKAVARLEAEVEANILKTVMTSSIVGGVILIVMLIINIIIANRTMVNPIRDLAESARQMSLGQMDTEIKVDSKDEIGELADAVSRMQKSLKVVFKKLRQK